MMSRRFFIAMAGLLALPVPAARAQAPDTHHNVEEVVVSAVPIERTVEELAQPTDVLDGDALARRQATSIGEAVAEELGVSATYFGPVASRPVVRGQFGERVTVLANGLDSLDASALSEDHAVSTDAILAERVEIVRGPATLLYGSSAAGGLVNVIDTRIHEAPPAAGHAGAAALGTDSATGKRSGALKLHLGNDRVVGHVDAFRRTTDAVRIPGPAESARLRASEGELDEDADEARGRIDNTDSETDGAAAAVSLLGEKGYVGVSVSTYRTEYGVPGHAHHGEEEGEEEEEEERVRIDLDQTRVDVRGAYDMGGVFERADVKFASNRYEHTEFEGAEVGTVYENDAVDLRIGLRQRSANALAGSVGVQYKSIDFDARGDEAFVPPSKTDQLSLFAFEEIALAEDLILQGSARLERQDIATPVAEDYDGTAFGASLGAIWRWREDLAVSGNLARTERHPNSTELYAFGPHVAVQRFERGAVSRGAGMLGKERSTNLDLTLRGERDRVQWAATAFFNRVDDYILLAPTPEVEDDFQVFDYVQADAELYGFEAEATIELLDAPGYHLHTRLFTDYVHGERRDTGAYLPRLTPLRYGIGVHYTRAALDTSLRVTWHADQDKVAGFELPTDGYAMLDAEASYRLDAQGLLLFARGTNLLDEDARRHTSPLKDLAPLPGRSLALGVRWDF